MKILSIKASVYTLMIIAVILAQASAQDIDYANLYSKKTLKQAYRTYAANLRGVWEEDLLGRLTVREKRAAANIKLNLPLSSNNDRAIYSE